MSEWVTTDAGNGLTIAETTHNDRLLRVAYRNELSDIFIHENGELVRFVMYRGKFIDALEKAFQVEEDMRKDESTRN